MTAVWRMQAVYWLLSGECSCILAPVWTMQGVYWLLSGECRLHIACCLENAGCIRAPVQRYAVCIFILLPGNAGCILSGECRLYIGSCLEDASCILAPVWRMQAGYSVLSGECRLYIDPVHINIKGRYSLIVNCMTGFRMQCAHMQSSTQAVTWLLSEE